MEKPSVFSRMRKAWNVFTGRESVRNSPYRGMSSSYRPDRLRLSRGNERSIVTAVYNQISIDCAKVKIKHVQLDKNGRYEKDRNSGLNECLTLSANVDQTGRAFRQDIFLSLLDEGSIAIIPVDTSTDPDDPDGTVDILSMRTGKIVEWYPRDVKVDVYNDRTGKHEQVIVPKTSVAIVESPLYAVINEPNSVLQRLIRKLNILDAIDEQSGSGKLDIIIQLPYTIKSPLKQQQAEERRQKIEDQLLNSKYGIAYADASEHITQLNRPVENNLMKQIEYLTSMLYSQLGLSQAILDGSANEEMMTNYYNRTIEPLVSAVVDEMKRKFLTKTARSQGQSIESYRDPLKSISASKLVEMGDPLTRNAIMTSNEIRSELGLPPSKEPIADELSNKNLNQPADGAPVEPTEQKENKEEEDTG